MKIEHKTEVILVGENKVDSDQHSENSQTGDGANIRMARGGVRRVLIVDDEELIRDVLKETFEDAGYEVSEAANGRAAFKMIVDSGFDCVVSDIRMPGGDGFELAQNVFNMTGERPKIFLVTGFSEITLEIANRWGVEDIFEKPFDIRVLLNAVEVAIAVKHPAKVSA